MSLRLFARKPSYRDQVFAEAQAMVDDGIEAEVVLDIFADDAGWLAPLLHTSEMIIDATGGAEPSYYFEASLKSRFIAEGRAEPERRPFAPPGPAPASWFRGAFAGGAVVALSGVAGVITLGFVTADSAVPGDWNYAFKRAGERVEYALATGDNRVTIDLQHTQARVYELNVRVDRGQVTRADIQRITTELSQVAELQKEGNLDPVQRASAIAIGASSKEILETVAKVKPELAPAARDALGVAASIGGAVTALDPVNPAEGGSASPTVTADPTATSASPAASPTPAETTVVPGETPTPTVPVVETLVPIPTPTATPTETPAPSATPDPSATSPAPSATPATSTEPQTGGG